MREYTTPAVIEPPTTGSLSDPVWANASSHPDTAVFSRRVEAGGWLDISAAEFARQVGGVAKGLIAAGVKHGDRVALLSATRYEWTLIDYAIWSIGAATVPIYETSSASQVQWILTDSEAVAAVVENAAHGVVVESARAEAPALQEVWQIESGAVDELTVLGQDITDAELDKRRGAVVPGDLATLIYTSGTTGPAQGLQDQPRELHGRARYGDQGAARPVQADRRLHAAVPAAGARVRPDHPGRLRDDAGQGRPHGGREEPGRGPRRVQADLHPQRAAGVREGVQHRQPDRARVRQGQDLRRRRCHRDRVLAGARQGRRRLRSEGPARPVRQARLRQAPRRARRAGRLRRLRRGAARRSAGSLLPRHRRTGPGGLRPDRDHRRPGREPARRHPHRHRRQAASGRDRGRRLRWRAVLQGRPGDGSATGRTTRPLPPRSTPTAGSTPATWASSTPTASSASPAGRRRSWSPPAART